MLLQPCQHYCWFNIKAKTLTDPWILGKTEEVLWNKTVSQNFEKKKKMFRSNITAKSIIHSKCFSPSPQKRPPQILKENSYKEALFETVYQTKYAKFHLVCPEIK